MSNPASLRASALDALPRIQAAITGRAQRRKWGAVLGILFGLPLCLLGPVILGSMYWMALWFLGWHQPIVWVYGIAIVVIVPLLFRLEIRTGGEYLGDTLRGSEPLVDNSAGLAMATTVGLGALAGAAVAGMVHPAAMPTGIVEVFLTGPRLVVGGWRHLRQASKLSGVDRELAARSIAALLQREHGLALKELTAIGRPLPELWPCLIWLAIYGWIGVSADQARVYLYSDSRRALRDVTG